MKRFSKTKDKEHPGFKTPDVVRTSFKKPNNFNNGKKFSQGSFKTQHKG